MGTTKIITEIDKSQNIKNWKDILNVKYKEANTTFDAINNTTTITLIPWKDRESPFWCNLQKVIFIKQEFSAQLQIQFNNRIFNQNFVNSELIQEIEDALNDKTLFTSKNPYQLFNERSSGNELRAKRLLNRKVVEFISKLILKKEIYKTTHPDLSEDDLKTKKTILMDTLIDNEDFDELVNEAKTIHDLNKKKEKETKSVDEQLDEEEFKADDLVDIETTTNRKLRKIRATNLLKDEKRRLRINARNEEAIADVMLNTTLFYDNETVKAKLHNQGVYTKEDAIDNDYYFDIPDIYLSPEQIAVKRERQYTAFLVNHPNFTLINQIKGLDGKKETIDKIVELIQNWERDEKLALNNHIPINKKYNCDYIKKELVFSENNKRIIEILEQTTNSNEFSTSQAISLMLQFRTSQFLDEIGLIDNASRILNMKVMNETTDINTILEQGNEDIKNSLAFFKQEKEKLMQQKEYLRKKAEENAIKDVKELNDEDRINYVQLQAEAETKHPDDIKQEKVLQENWNDAIVENQNRIEEVDEKIIKLSPNELRRLRNHSVGNSDNTLKYEKPTHLAKNTFVTKPLKKGSYWAFDEFKDAELEYYYFSLVQEMKKNILFAFYIDEFSKLMYVVHRKLLYRIMPKTINFAQFKHQSNLDIMLYCFEHNILLSVSACINLIDSKDKLKALSVNEAYWQNKLPEQQENLLVALEIVNEFTNNLIYVDSTNFLGFLKNDFSHIILQQPYQKNNMYGSFSWMQNWVNTSYRNFMHTEFSNEKWKPILSKVYRYNNPQTNAIKDIDLKFIIPLIDKNHENYINWKNNYAHPIMFALAIMEMSFYLTIIYSHWNHWLQLGSCTEQEFKLMQEFCHTVAVKMYQEYAQKKDSNLLKWYNFNKIYDEDKLFQTSHLDKDYAYFKQVPVLKLSDIYPINILLEYQQKNMDQLMYEFNKCYYFHLINFIYQNNIVKFSNKKELAPLHTKIKRNFVHLILNEKFYLAFKDKDSIKDNEGTFDVVKWHLIDAKKPLNFIDRMMAYWKMAEESKKELEPITAHIKILDNIALSDLPAMIYADNEREHIFNQPEMTEEEFKELLKKADNKPKEPEGIYTDEEIRLGIK